MPHGFHRPCPEIYSDTGTEGEGLDACLVFGRIGEQGEDVFAVVGKDFYAGLVDEDAKAELPVAGQDAGMGHARELGQDGIGTVGTVDNEVVRVCVVTEDDLAAVAHAEVQAEDIGAGGIERDVQLVDIGRGGELRQGMHAHGQRAAERGLSAKAEGRQLREGLLHQAEAAGGGAQAEVAGHGPESFAIGGGRMGSVVPRGHPTDGGSGGQGAVVVAEGSHCVVIKTFVDVKGFSRMVVCQGEGRAVEVAHEVLHLCPVDGDDHHPARVGGIAVDGQAEEVGTFPGLFAVARRTEVAGPGPMLQVGRGVDAHLLLQCLGHHHHPTVGLRVEEDGGVAKLGAVDVQHGVAFVVVKGSPAVGAVRDGLRLLLGVLFEGGVDGHVGAAPESGGVVAVDDDGAGEVGDVIVRALHAEG